ncbi:MAG: trans-sulfuration enzyme family protein [Pyrinomonadaceae bacterium]
MQEKSFYTLAVHAGTDLSENFGAISVPIYTASVYAFPDADTGAAIHNHEREGYFYGRFGNPTQTALEKTIAELERGESALAFASGMAAVSAALLTIVKSGDHIVAPTSMYSTTTLFLNHLAENFGVETSFVDATTTENYASAIKPNTKVFWIETPSNPLLRITDISEVAKIARQNNITTVADNTFATPFNQRPLDSGIDLLIHSATKYLGGHSDLAAGLLVGKKEYVEQARLKTTKLYGGNIAPQVAWLVLRGIKTLALRMERHNQNAFALANMLSKHSQVKEVFYPALSAQNEIAKRQMKGFGGIITFDIGGIEAGKTLVNNLDVCTLATSLGGVETTIIHPASTTHSTLSSEERLRAGITDGLVRLSVGIEYVDDLMADLQQALDKI